MNNSVSTATGKAKIKIVLLGNQSVGKSAIIEKYVNNRFDQSANPTVGIDFLAKNTTFKNKSYRLQLWDTAGQQRFRSMIPSYLKDAHCALIVFDVSSAGSLSHVDMWLKLYTDNKLGEGFAFLVGNKIDLDFREIKVNQGMKKAEELGLPYFQISAKTGQNLDSLFHCLIDGCVDKTINIASLGMTQNSHKKIVQNQKIVKMIRQQEGQKQQQSEIKNEVDKTAQKMKQKPDIVGKDNLNRNTEQKTIVLRTQDVKVQQKKKEKCC